MPPEPRDHDDLVLVTGASGYIGSHVIQALQTAGYRVRGTVRNLQDQTKTAPLQALCPGGRELELVEADLQEYEGWPGAVQDCRYVIHVASPIPRDVARVDEEAVIRVAVSGTLNVLRACREAGSVQRVVLTSSTAAVGLSASSGQTLTEEDWTDLSHPAVWFYVKSKVLAEQEAWKFIDKLPVDEKFELAVINPGLVIGPVLTNINTSSLLLIERMMTGHMPLVPKLKWPCIDVRDVAAAHIAAMVKPEAAGHRHNLVHQSFWLHELAQFLKEDFEPLGYHVSTRSAPSWLLKILGWCRKDVRIITGSLDVDIEYDNHRMTEVLGIKPERSIKCTLNDTVRSMIDKQLLPKPS